MYRGRRVKRPMSLLMRRAILAQGLRSGSATLVSLFAVAVDKWFALPLIKFARFRTVGLWVDVDPAVSLPDARETA
ncbi:hypothetical protein SAMN06295937_103218 [Sphingopyxis flava]|uniref:Uncharacterized protein n=1 Tax=Sphingopyxis flava TaxID=1507287 RepID=A0A1T5FC42_9SPHN|nr:hypothetical protein SAMN06295937_103218 [Sphingopyxis flava]